LLDLSGVLQRRSLWQREELFTAFAVFTDPGTYTGCFSKNAADKGHLVLLFVNIVLRNAYSVYPDSRGLFSRAKSLQERVQIVSDAK
jgi:hypothetical protein